MGDCGSRASPGAEPTSSGGLPRGNRLAHLAVRTSSCCYGSAYLAAEGIDLSNWKILLLIVVLGIAFSAFSVLLLGPFVGWREAKSLVPKSVTAPVALGVIKEGSLGKAPQDQLVEPLLAIGIMISALSGAVLGPVVLQLHQRT